MANRTAPLRQSDATRYFKAAAAAGYGRARLIVHLDGRIELIVDSASKEARTNAANNNSWDEVLK